jgi:RNA polymerase sigma factor (sigma-70 family)
MPTASPTELARRALADHLAALQPAELLTRYATRRDPEAFAGLVQQFGPMVLGVCRRVLGPSSDVDDAFQAVFLTLARRADSFRDGAALPAWLHRVALRTARKALARRAVNPVPALVPEPVDPADPLAGVAWRDVRRVLDEELDALPERFRGPVVLCWLDGLTQDEAAGRLGFSLNTLKRRLDAARDLLRARLVRRGLAPVLVAAAVFDPAGLRADVPDEVAARAVELGVNGATVPPGVQALEAAVSATAPARRYLKGAVALALVAGAVTAGVALFDKPPAPPRNVAKSDDGSEGTMPAPEPGPPAPQLGPPTIPRYRMTHAGSAEAVAWNPDGSVLASGSRDKTVKLWDVKTGKETTALKGHTDEVDAVAFRPDGKMLASASADETIRLWDAATGKEKAALKGHASGVCAVAWSPDGKVLASGSAEIKLWDVTTRKEKDTLLGHPVYVRSVAFSPDGATLASGGTDNTVKLWDVSPAK